ncbi:hypothetical protein HK100_008982, partial [Physocladia obscura]
MAAYRMLGEIVERLLGGEGGGGGGGVGGKMDVGCDALYEHAGNSTALACAFATAHCGGPGAVNYMALHFCVLGGGRVGVAGLAGLLASCFVSVAAVAGGFLCANLSAATGLLRLDEAVAGVTLAALGNGAPDVFATFSAVRGGRGGLAVGELLGAALFVTLVVVGAVAVTAPPTLLPRRPFVRDAVFLLATSGLVLAVAAHGRIAFGLALALIVVYMVYVAVVVASAFADPSDPTSDALIDPHSLASSNPPIQPPGTNNNSNNVFANTSNPHANARASLSRNLDFDLIDPSDFYSPHLDFNHLPSETHQINLPGFLSRTALPIRGRSFVPHLNKELFPFLAAYSLPDNNNDDDDDDDDDNDDDDGENDDHAELFENNGNTRNRGRRQIINNSLKSWAHRVLVKLDKHRPLLRALRNSIVPYLAQWDQMSMKDKILSLASTPIGTSLKLTIPVVHRTDIEKIRNFALPNAGSIVRELGPLLDRAGGAGNGVHSGGGVTSGEGEVIIFENDSDSDYDDTQPLLNFNSSNGGSSNSNIKMLGKTTNNRASLASGTNSNNNSNNQPSNLNHQNNTITHIGSNNNSNSGISRLLMSDSDRYLVALQLFFGTQFAASVFMERGNTVTNWIIWASSSIANEIVGLLDALGIILHIDEVILGLTIFAIGNCMGDLMTNLSIARMGYPKMALGACFGSPMMNFLLGLGISVLTMTAETQSVYIFETGPALRRATVCLIVSLIITMLLVGASGFRTNAQIGRI